MLLTRAEADLVFKLHCALMQFVNAQLKIGASADVPESAADYRFAKAKNALVTALPWKAQAQAPLADSASPNARGQARRFRTVFRA